jgi:sugar phosphate isomerase/epimerase
MKKIPLALQLWSVRDEMRRDFAGTAAEVGKMGYHGVELAGYGNLDVQGAKAALDAANLAVAGMHVGFAALQSDLNAVISDALLLGSRHVTCPSWPAAHYVSAGACERIGERLAEIGRTLRTAGLTFSFHNHAPELTLIEGRPVFDWILGAAAPRDLKAEPDVYWLQLGGCAPEKFLRDQGARCPLVHLKDEKELGRGPVDFARVFAAIDEIGAAEWLIVEQEAYSHAPLESVRLCFQQLQVWGRT